VLQGVTWAVVLNMSTAGVTSLPSSPELLLLPLLLLLSRPTGLWLDRALSTRPPGGAWTLVWVGLRLRCSPLSH
jgi:hypothetical protein